jgi:hypothetical protein
MKNPTSYVQYLATWPPSPIQAAVLTEIRNDNYDLVLNQTTTSEYLFWLKDVLETLLLSGKKFIDEHCPDCL